jgi:hypothetical protein
MGHICQDVGLALGRGCIMAIAVLDTAGRHGRVQGACTDEVFFCSLQ